MMHVIGALLCQVPVQQKDFLDILSTVCNCALAVVGIVGLILARNSLKTIERQTTSIERQTKTLLRDNAHAS